MRRSSGFVLAVGVAVFLVSCDLFSKKSDEPESKPQRKVDPSLFVAGDAGKLHPIQPGSTAVLGSGFNSFKNEVLGHCVEDTNTKTMQGTPLGKSLKSELEVFYAHDVQELGKSMGVTANAQARFGFGKVSAEAAYANSEDFSSRSSFLVARGSTYNETETLADYRLRPDALQVLRDNPAAFFKRCGDQFVAARVPGAMFHAVAEIRDTTMATRNSLKVKASFKWLFVKVGGGYETEGSEMLASHSMRFKVIQRGVQDAVPREIHEFIDAARSLNAKINEQEGGATAVAFVTSSYDVVSNWPADVTIPSLVKQARTLETLADWHRQLSIQLADLKLAYDEPKETLCPMREKKFSRAFENVEAGVRRFEERAHACLDEPMSKCDVSDLPPLGRGGYNALLESCSDAEAAARRRQERHVAQAAERDRENQEREAKAEAERTSQLACRGTGRPNCPPCKRWSFGYLEYDSPAKKGNGFCWDWPGCGLPDPLLEVMPAGGTKRSTSRKNTKHVEWHMANAITVRPGTELTVRVRDIDGGSHDHMGKFSERVPDQLTDGSWILGNGSTSMRGKCIE